MAEIVQQWQTGPLTEKAKEFQRTVNAYHRVCESQEWELVRKDLEKRFGINKPAFQFLPDGRFDIYQGVHKDGARAVMCHVDFMLEHQVIGDANIEQPAVTIRK